MEDLLLSAAAPIGNASFSGIAGMLGRFDIVWSYAEFCRDTLSIVHKRHSGNFDIIPLWTDNTIQEI